MSNSIKISVMGDICPGEEFDKEVDKVFCELKDRIIDSDIRVANMEYAIPKDNEPILKTGPCLKGSKKTISIFQYLDIRCITLANNHSGDYGEKGLLNTIKEINDCNIVAIGAGKDILEAYSPFYLIDGNIKLCIISVCENEFGIAGTTGGAAGYDSFRLMRAIIREKNNGFYVVVIFHGGNEHIPIPSPNTIQRYRDIIDSGASAVIGMHPHCPQGYEIYNSGIIVYSLGNLYFPRESRKEKKDPWNNGYIANLEIKENGNIQFGLVSYTYDFANDRIRIHDKEDSISFRNYLNRLNSIINNEKKLKAIYDAWVINRAEYYTNYLYSEENTIQKALQVQNMFRCEAHKELMQRYYELLAQGELDKHDKEWGQIKELQKIVL